MQEIVIRRNEAGQRLDKFLGKYMRMAPKSFFYRMMRKKNITLNNRKCEGMEFLCEGDTVKLFLSDETIQKFSETPERFTETAEKISETSKRVPDAGISKIKTGKLDILYEDTEIILINKPSGMLSQKAKPEDVSLVEVLIDYLLESGAVTKDELRSFRPSVCNRLDRNTSGIVAAGKSLAGLQMLSEIFRDRRIHKYYLCIVAGEVREASTLEGWLIKDSRTNKVKILTKQETADFANLDVTPGSAAGISEDTFRNSVNAAESSRSAAGKRAVREIPLFIKTRYEPLASNGSYTLLQATLFTGRSHQIRAHLASIGHPIAGDRKYGSRDMCSKHTLDLLKAADRRYALHSQLLHSFRLEFPELSGTFASLSRSVFEAPLPEEFSRMAAGEGLLSMKL